MDTIPVSPSRPADFSLAFLLLLNIHALQVQAKTCQDPDDELLSVASLKHGTRVVTGAQTGAASIYAWDKWDEPPDRIVVSTEAVDALLRYDEDTLISGGEDGLLRLINVQVGSPICW